MKPTEPLPKLPRRDPEGHKGAYGRALLIGGSRGMAGAISLAGIACLRSGAGLVRVAVPDSVLDAVSTFEPSLMTSPLSDKDGQIAAPAKKELQPMLKAATAVACGPGLSRSDELNELVAWLYTTLPQPAVFDADALNALASQPDALRKPGGPRILTPHPGEFARLSGTKGTAAEADRARMEACAAQLAALWGVVIVLKGHRTLITDGVRQSHNTTGNPGMATGGAGDVLTGVTTALLCQGLERYEAARLATHVHGLAGDLAAAELGEVSLIASDLLRFLPAAFQQLDS